MQITCKSIKTKWYSITKICTVMHKNWNWLIKDGSLIRIQRKFKNTKDVFVWIQKRSIIGKCKFNKIKMPPKVHLLLKRSNKIWRSKQWPFVMLITEWYCIVSEVSGTFAAFWCCYQLLTLTTNSGSKKLVPRFNYL